MKAGAKKVYAVEASDMVEVLKEIVKKNDPDGIIEVIFTLPLQFRMLNSNLSR